MSLLAVVASLGALFLLLEGLFFLYCFRWLSAGRRQRERDFLRLDAERAELLDLQSALAVDVREAKRMSEDTLGRLSRLGTEAGAEWRDMMERMESLLHEVETRAQETSEKSLSDIHRGRLTLDKAIRDAQVLQNSLEERVQKARALLRFFEKNVQTDEIVKELQAEKYESARQMLSDGNETSVICKKLGLSQSEVALLSYVR
ncbi:MAG: hypothetical protein IOD12_06270 [Silvanigrellales bacterium]|jgi:hypothetical protein|nr:hypothetical protein [Silvanigrellales bacterium]